MSIAGTERALPRNHALTTQRLRLWLRLLRASRGIEGRLRVLVQRTFGITLPQFDVLAALDRRGRAMSMTELSRTLMISNGNVTALIDRLVALGLVDRTASPDDRRANAVVMTPKGARAFAGMAKVHAGWVDELLSDLDQARTETMMADLDRVVARVRPVAKPAKAASATSSTRASTKPIKASSRRP